MPSYKVRNVLEAAGVKVFWKVEAGATRGALPEEDGSQDRSQERIKKLQQDLHEARQDLTAKNRQLARLRKPQKQKGPQREPERDSKERATVKVDPAQFGATLPIPPRDMGPITQARNVKSYLNLGQSIKNRMLHYTGVTPTSSILDIGAGPGRVARHFVDFIEPPGRYVGVDIEKPNMDWCQENISPANPAFGFFHQNVHNGMYNPEGEYKASEYEFPFEDGSFDVILLTSVFTHLVPEDAQNYLREISRLLKPDGVCFSTWFLLGRDLGVKYMNAHSKEGRAGFGFGYVLGMLEAGSLTLAQEPVLGGWRGQKPALRNGNAGGQDILLLKRGAGEDLASRYGAPGLPDSSVQELEETSGTVQMFDPVASSVTIEDGEEERTFVVPAEAELTMHGQRVDSAVIRPGQEATIRFAGDGRGGVACSVHATDHARPLDGRMRRVSGTLEALDRERGLVTLIVGNSVRTFRFDPENVEVRSDGELLEVGDLRLGQGIAVEHSGGRGIIHSLS